MPSADSTIHIRRADNWGIAVNSPLATQDQDAPEARTCCVCQSTRFEVSATRGDGLRVFRCTQCDMGVIETIESDLQKFYGDDYYGSSSDIGYSDYTLMAEHGVSWAAAIVKLIKTEGNILDIGCVDGYLLNKFQDGFDRYGIEANPGMSKRAEDDGVQILGHDIFDSEIITHNRGKFDVVTAIAVFEHLRDIRNGFTISMDLLKKNGFLLFEVPLISNIHTNAMWYNSSYEHVFYPSETSIRYLVEKELNLTLIGSEVWVRGYASTYVGIVTANRALAAKIAAIFADLISTTAKLEQPSLRQARVQLQLIHAASSADAVVGDLEAFPADTFTAPILRRITQVWKEDIYQASAVRAQNAQMTTELATTRSQLETEIAEHQITAQNLSERISINETALLQANTLSLSRQVETDRSTAEADRIRAEVHRAEASHERLAAELAAIKSQLGTEIAGHQITAQNLSERISISETTLLQANTLSLSRQDETDRSTAEADRIRAEVHRAEARHERLAAIIERLRGEAAVYKATHLATAEQLKLSHAAELARANTETLVKAAELERARSLADISNRRAERRTAELREKDAEIERLSDGAQQAAANVERLKAERDALHAAEMQELERLKAEHDALHAADTEKLERAVGALTDVANKLRSELVEITDRNEENLLQQQRDRTETELRSQVLAGENAAIRQKYDLSRNELAQLEEGNQRLRVELSTGHLKASELEVLLANSSAQLAQATENLAVANQDRQINTKNMIQAMIGAEDKIVAARRETALLRQSADAVATQAGSIIALQSEPLPGSGRLRNRLFGRPPETPTVLDRLRMAGDDARDKRDWSAAVSDYTLYLAARPDDFGIWVQLGHVTKEHGDLDGANAAYQSALSINPNDPDLLLNLGHLRKIQNDIDDALEFYARSVEADPNSDAAQELIVLRQRVTGPQEYSVPGYPRKMRLLAKTGFTPSEPAEYPDPWPANRPLVSVVIPCFNYGNFVADAVASLEAQTFSSLEIIVVEGGSSSLESRRLVAGLTGSRVRVLMQAEPNRAGANRNFGISRARGKYICCLDADDRLDPTYIEKAVFLMEHFDFDVVSCALQYFGDRDDRCGIIPRPTLEDIVQGNHVLTCAMFRRSFWEKSGGYRDSDPKLGYIYEDWTFWMRLGTLGARFFNIATEYLFNYRVHGVSLSNHDDVVPMDMQAKFVRFFNEDRFSPGVVEHSRDIGLQDRVIANPLRNLSGARTIALPGQRTILLAMPFLLIGGAERLLSSITRSLTASGWRIIIVTTIPIGPEHGDATSWFQSATKEIYHLPRFLAPDQWQSFVRFIFATRDINLLWIVGSAFFYDLLPALKSENPTLLVCDLLFNTIGHTQNNRAHAAEIDLTICENREVLDWLLAHGESAGRIQIIESGVDLAAHSPSLRDRSVLSALGIANATFVVGFSGRWSEEKDPLGFIEIARLVPADLDVAFVMTGTGAMRGEIEAAIQSAGLPPDRFHLVGLVDNIHAYVASFDLLCLPSRLDGRPVVVLEALATGVPVLASKVGALPELISSGHNGVLCAAGDYQGFADQIVRLSKLGPELKPMQNAARASAEQTLDARTMFSKYEATLTELTSRRSPRSTLGISGGLPTAID